MVADARKNRRGTRFARLYSDGSIGLMPAQQRIIDTYLPRRTEVALGGIEAWENFSLRVVRMPDDAGVPVKIVKLRG